MTSCYIITGCVTSTGYLVTQFASRSWQPLFANNFTGTVRLTMSQLSVTKAGGLSDTTGAERSTGGEIAIP